MRMSKERREEIGINAEQAIGARGAILIDDFLARFNELSDTQATTEEILHGIRRYLATTPQYLLVNQFVMHDDKFIYSARMAYEQAFAILEADLNGIVLCPCGCGEEMTVDDDLDYEEMIDERLRVVNMLAIGAQHEQEALEQLIVLMADTAVGLYGVLNHIEFANVINHYFDEFNVSANMVHKALVKIQEDEVHYRLYEDLIILAAISPDIDEIDDEDIELIEQIRLGQRQTKRYLPAFEEFFSYAGGLHTLASVEFNEFTRFIDENSEQIGCSEEDVASSVVGFLHLGRVGMIPDYFLDYFRVEGFKFGSKKFADEFLELATELFLTLNSFILNGHSVLTVKEQREQKPTLRLVPKVGRNDDCPCGSGKKHKKCCL